MPDALIDAYVVLVIDFDWEEFPDSSGGTVLDHTGEIAILLDPTNHGTMLDKLEYVKKIEFEFTNSFPLNEEQKSVFTQNF